MAGERGVVAEHVDESAMIGGITLANWFENEARRLFVVNAESDEDRHQRELIELIERLGGRCAVRQLRHHRRQYRDDPEMARADLDSLVEAGLGREEQRVPSQEGGRPQDLFILHPVNETPDGDSATGGFVDVDTVDAGENADRGTVEVTL